jgi:hypothetical protein
VTYNKHVTGQQEPAQNSSASSNKLSEIDGYGSECSSSKVNKEIEYDISEQWKMVCTNKQ